VTADGVIHAQTLQADGASGFDIEPAFPVFAAAYQRGDSQVVWTRIVADLETPVSAYLKLTQGCTPGQAMNFLFESVEGGAVRGRYSMIGLDPDLIWRASGPQAAINRSPASHPDEFEPDPLPTLKSLRALIADSALELPEGLPPMAAGVFGYMGYDTIRNVEHLPNQNPDDLGVPDGILIRPTVMVIFDAVKDEMTIVMPIRPDGLTTAQVAYAAAQHRLTTVISALDRPLTHLAGADSVAIIAHEPVSNTTPAKFLSMVGKAKEYIAAGDIFQVVLSQRFSAPFDLAPFSLYRALRRTNPSPFLFHLNFGSFALVGSSPEILVRVRAGTVTIRPIAGTTRRGIDEREDAVLAKALLEDPKERAEHLMLLDLGRNDVGRVAVPGTIRVTDQFVVERYSHVMHIVSNVEGQLDPAHDRVDALMAGFPAGTVSGAPKVRAMQVIDELEQSKRGPYAGCVGYFAADGEMDTAIVLRTAIIKDGMMHVQAGAGVVYDSVPENEQQECINKAKALVRAAEEAVRFACRKKGTTPTKTKGNGGLFD
jgi:anthranilate synthase component I